MSKPGRKGYERGKIVIVNGTLSSEVDSAGRRCKKGADQLMR